MIDFNEKDPREREIDLKEYFKQINQKIKQLDIIGGAKEFTFEDGFSCISRIYI